MVHITELSKKNTRIQKYSVVAHQRAGFIVCTHSYLVIYCSWL